MKTFGYLRFSYTARVDTALQGQYSSHEDFVRALFDPARIENRFYFFEKLLLPSMKHQIDDDFKLCVLASEIMPEDYKVRLMDLTRDIPQVDVVYSQEESVGWAFRPWIDAQTADIKGKSVHFRIDDDDALASHFIRTIKHLASRLPGTEMITLPRGVYLSKHKGKPVICEWMRPYVGLGLSFIRNPGRINSPYAGAAHHLQHRHVTSFMNPKPISYIRTHHDWCDTFIKGKHAVVQSMREDRNYGTPEGEQLMRDDIKRHFPFTSYDELAEIIMNQPPKPE